MKVTLTITIQFPPTASEDSIKVFRKLAPEALRHDMMEVVKSAFTEEDQDKCGGEVEVSVS